jgi:hypothetical protein
MAMTEAEAKTKWCPNSRIAVYAGSGGAACNRHPQESVEEDTMCRASGCMFWRWDAGSSPRARAPHTLPSQRAALAELSPDPTEGYCGQAGPA